MRSPNLWAALSTLLCLSHLVLVAQSAKPAISLDEYLNTTDISAESLSPDGKSAVIATETPDWKKQHLSP
jgi:hypothetical protein